MNPTFRLIIVCLSLFLIFGCKEGIPNNPSEFQIKLDSIDFLLNASNSSNKVNSQEDYLEKAYQLSTSLQDSLRVKTLSRIAFKYYQANDSVHFFKRNTESMRLAKKLNDSAQIAQIHWNFGAYYNRFEELDSAFYHYANAAKLYNEIRNNFYSGRLLYNMSIIQKNLRDYTGAEITSFQSILKFDKKKHHYNLYLSYNNLGVIYSYLKEFDKSIESHNKALVYLEEVKNKRTLRESSLNNIGLAYQNKGDNNEALNNFEEALTKDSLKIKNRALYAKLYDNLTYSKFLLNKNENLESEFKKALGIRDSMNNISGIALSKIHLSEYYAYKQDTTKAITFAQEAHDLAQSVDNHRDQLNSLKLLSKIDPENSGDYLNKFVKLNDSLQKEERAIRNKFTRIRFQTDEYIDQTEKLSRENLLIIILGIGSLLLLGSIFVIRLQRSKNKRLLLEQNQQNDREQIYQLMLEQQSKLEEGRVSERTRISEELHDGILGSMYGTRMGLGFLEFESNQETKSKFDKYLSELLQIEKEVRAVSHALQSEILNSNSEFINVVETYINKLDKNTKLNITLNNDPNIAWDMVSGEVKINFFRIIQETYYNSVKYAKANNFKVSFLLSNDFINLVIEDDGIGFNNKKAKKGIGFKNMKNRIENLQGNLSILSSPNNGTKISAIIKL